MASRSWIGGSYFTNGNVYPQWTGNANWVEGSYPTTTAHGLFDINSGSSDVYLFAGPSTTTGGAHVIASYAANLVQIDNFAIGVNTLGFSTNSSGTSYTFYVASNKTLIVNMGTSSNNGIVFSVNQPIAYVDSGGVLALRTFGGSLGVPFRKQGPGRMYFQYLVTAANNAGGSLASTANSKNGSYNSFVRLEGGSIAIRASDAAASTVTNAFGSVGVEFYDASTSIVMDGGATTSASHNANASLLMTTAGKVRIEGANNGLIFTSASGAGALTIESSVSSAYAQFNGAVTCPVTLAATSLMKIGAAGSISSTTVSGTGTVNMTSGSTMSSVTVASTITTTGTFSATSSTFNGNMSATVTVASGDVYFNNATNGGAIASVAYANGYVSGAFTAGGGTTQLTGGGSGDPVRGGLTVYGPSGSLPSDRTVQLQNYAWLRLGTGATVSSPTTALNDATSVVIDCRDATSCTYSGTFDGSAKASGSVKVRAADSGTLTLSGSFSSGGAVFTLNGDSGYAGTLKVTGTGFTGANPTISSGTLHLNSSSAVNVGTTLSVSGTAKLACQAASGAQPRINGNVSLAAGTTLKFGAP